jgi:hypothetical protein
MPVTKENFERAKQIHNQLQMKLNSLTETKGMTPENPDYISAAEDFNTFDRALRDYTASQRQVDDNGRLTAEPATALAPTVDGDPESEEYGFFYEPNVREVQNFFRKNPGALDRLGLRDWATGIAEPEKREDVRDPMSGAVQGWNVVPAKSYLDVLREKDRAYELGADELYRVKSEEAKKYGTNLKRYKDIHFQPGQKIDYLSGGAGKIGDRVVAPALMGAADAATLGQATPLGDALTDLIDYEAGKRGYDIGPQPKGQDVIDRSHGAYFTGNLLGYGLPRNPANIVQGGLAEIGDYAARGVGGRALGAAVAGGVTNTIEGATSDFARSANEGEPIEMGLARAGANMPMNMLVGGATGGLLDLGASGIQAGRQMYRGGVRNAPLRTLEKAGGGAHIGMGVTAPPEIMKHYQNSLDNQINEAGLTAGGMAARDIAPDIERSIVKQAEENEARIGGQMEEYFGHPAYNQKEISAQPAVEGLIDLARRGWAKDHTGAPVNTDPKRIDQIGGIVRNYARVLPATVEEAGRVAAEHGGVVVDGNLTNTLFALDESNSIRPGEVGILVPIKMNAEALTILENRIDTELDMARVRRGGSRGNDDPVWNRFNQKVKAMRDEFPLYRDAEGNLVPPPPDSVRQEPFPMDPEAVPREDPMRVLPPPERVAGGPQRRPEGLMGVGGPQPALPDTFDPRAGKQPGAPAGQLPRPIGVGGEGMVARPEGLYAVGPGGPPIPENPFDPRLPTSREALNPQRTMSVQGEYGPPPPLDPRARPGVGDYRNPAGPVQSFTREGLPIPGTVSPKQTVGVRGDYNKPPEIKPERAPITERGGAAPESGVHIGVDATHKMAKLLKRLSQESPEAIAKDQSIEALLKERDALPLVYDNPEEREALIAAVRKNGGGQMDIEKAMLRYQIERGEAALARGEPPRGGRAPAVQPEAELLAKNKLAMKVDEPFADVPLTEKVAQREYGKTEPAAAEEPRVPTERVIKQEPKQELSPLELDLDRGLKEKYGPDESLPAPTPREWAEANEEGKVFVEDIFSPGREARAAEMEKVQGLAEHTEALEEAMGQINDVDKRLGPISDEDKRTMLAKLMSNKIGKEITVEDLVRAGLIATGMVQLATDDEGDGAGAPLAAMGIFGFGGRRGRRGNPFATPGGPSSVMDDIRASQKPPKPTQPEATLPNGKVVRGFSAMRNEQHGDLSQLDKIRQKLGIGDNQSVENRIRTFGQQEGQGTADEMLLAEAKKLGKAKELHTAAGAAVFPQLRDRATFGGNQGVFMKLVDLIGLRGYKGAELLAGRYNNKNVRNPFEQRAKPGSPYFWNQPETYSERIMQSFVEDPARRLLNLSGGSPGARHGDDIRKLIEEKLNEDYYEEKGKPKRKQPSP